MMSLRDWIMNVLLIGQAIAFLWHLSLVAYYGRVLIQEPSLTILILEFVLFIGITAFGVTNLIKAARRR